MASVGGESIIYMPPCEDPDHHPLRKMISVYIPHTQTTYAGCACCIREMFERQPEKETDHGRSRHPSPR